MSGATTEKTAPMSGLMSEALQTAIGGTIMVLPGVLELMNPRLLYSDRDGTPNYMDRDNDNDGIFDDSRRSQG